MRSYNFAILTGSSNFIDYGMGVDLARALTRMGYHKITHINYKELYELNGPSRTIKIIEDELKENNVDIIIYGLDNNFEFSIEFFSVLRRSYFTVMYVGDDEHYFDKSARYYSQAFDLVITVGRLSVLRYELYGVDAIPATAPFDVSNMKNPAYKKIHDVCFVGGIENKIGRKEYLNHLIENKIDVKNFGHGTSGGVVTRDEMNRLYGSSKIGLGFAGVSTSSCLDKDITINRRIKQLKGRSWEVPLTGTFLLAEYAPGIEEIFDVGSEIDVFHDKNELLNKIRYYLNNEVEREEMATKAFNKAIRICDELNVCREYLEVIGNKLEAKNRAELNSNMPIYKDPIFKRAFSSFHLSKMLGFLSRGMFGKALDEFMIYIKYPFFDGGVFLFYIKRFLANISWLRNIVRKIKNIAKKKHDNKV